MAAKIHPDSSIGPYRGVLAYFDARGGICEKEEAAYAKLVTDDGPLFFSVAATRQDRVDMAWDAADHPRDEMGRFVGDGDGIGYIATPVEASHAIVHGERATISRSDIREVLLRAAKEDEKADLTNLHVEGTDVFGGGLNIPRGAMPQISSDEQPSFLAHLSRLGIDVVNERVPAMSLQPTQNEISAGRVKGQLARHEKGEDDLRPIMVSKDSKVLDGHHRWALGVVLELEKKQDDIPVLRLMVNRSQALDVMQKYMDDRGIARKQLSYRERLAVMFLLGDAPGHPFRGNQHTDGSASSLLPDDPHRYFEINQESVMIPLEKLRTTHHRPAGIVHAEQLMESSLSGGEKRSPITVRPNEDGTYDVLDGNSTTAVAKKHGWGKLPAKILNA